MINKTILECPRALDAVRMKREKYTLTEIGRKYNICGGRVSEIIKKYKKSVREVRHAVTTLRELGYQVKEPHEIR